MKIKIQYRENKENQSSNANKQLTKMRKTKHKEEKLKNTNKIKVVKNNDKIIIIHIHNKIPALWDSKVTFGSVSQFLVLALCSPFQSFSGPFLTPCLTVSFGGEKKKGGGKREDPKRKKKG